MKRLSEILCWAVVILAAGTTASLVHVQSASGRALMAYKEGVNPEQENADRGACHEWAVQQTGFDPSAIYQAQNAGVDTKTILRVTGKLDAAAGYQDPRWGSGGLANARGTADVRRFNELYESYLTAGALCLQARGYTVAR
jgi:hypothetical protein